MYLAILGATAVRIINVNTCVCLGLEFYWLILRSSSIGLWNFLRRILFSILIRCTYLGISIEYVYIVRDSNWELENFCLVSRDCWIGIRKQKLYRVTKSGFHDFSGTSRFDSSNDKSQRNSRGTIRPVFFSIAERGVGFYDDRMKHEYFKRY